MTENSAFGVVRGQILKNTNINIVYIIVPDWREDLRCGPNYPLQDGRPAQCDPNAVYPCCSPAGWCGNTDAHCKCSGCNDFRPTPPVTPGNVLPITNLF